MKKKEGKISTCVYVHSILHHWACILMFEGHFIKYVCWWELVCELSETRHCLYPCFIYFESEMSDLSLRSSVSLSFPSLHSLMMWLHFMLDSSRSSLFFVFFASLSFLYLFFIHPFHFTPCHFLTTTRFPVCYSLCIIITHLIINLILLIASLLLSYSHWAPSGPWLLRFSIHVAFHTWGHGFLIIEYLDLVFLHFYHPITLAYVTSHVLRPPWDHGIRCRLRQPLLGQVFDIWLIFGCHHTSSSRGRFIDVWVCFRCGFRWPGLHSWWLMIWFCVIFLIYHTFDVILGYICFSIEIYRSS